MDLKSIALKEVAGEDVSTLTKDFTDEQRKEYDKTVSAVAKEEKAKELEALKGIRAAKAAVGDGKPQDNSAIEDFQKKTREEQIAKARTKFLSENTLTPEQIAKLDEEFKREDSGKIDADLIYGDFKKAYVKSDPDKFLAAQKAQEEAEKAAQEAIAAAAGAGNSGAGSGGNKKQYAPAVIKAVNEAKARGIPLTYEEAERGINAGSGWRKTA